MRLHENAKHQHNQLDVIFKITADRCHSLNAAFCTNTNWTGVQVRGDIETKAPKTGMFQNTTDTCHHNNAVVCKEYPIMICLLR